LLHCHPAAQSGSWQASSSEHQWVRQIEKQPRGHLNFAGRQYTLVADVDLNRVPGRDSELPGTVRRIAWAYKKFKDIEDPAFDCGIRDALPGRRANGDQDELRTQLREVR
jgi:hypothetical protein